MRVCWFPGRIQVALLSSLLFGIAGFAEAEDSTLIAKVTDFSRRADFRLLNRDEYRDLERTIAEEKRLYRKALDLTERAWNADKDYCHKPFPSSAICVRKISKMGRAYESRQSASDKLVYYENKECAKRISEQRRQERKYRKLRRARGLLKRDKLEEEIEDRDRQDLCDRARAVYAMTLKELMNGNRATTSAGSAGLPAYR